MNPITQQTTPHPNNSQIPLRLTRDQWNILIPFLTNQIDHAQVSVLEGRLRYRIVRHLDNMDLLRQLQAIENQLRIQFYNARRETND